MKSRYYLARLGSTVIIVVGCRTLSKLNNFLYYSLSFSLVFHSLIKNCSSIDV